MQRIASTAELQVELQKLLRYSQTARPSRQHLASTLQLLSERMTMKKHAALDEGPVGRVLNKCWNQLHDMEYDLRQTLRDYSDAAHFMDGPAERDAKEMIKKIEAVAKAIDKLAKDDFNDLADAEAAFVKKHGEPSSYSDDMRRQIFPR